MLMDNNKIQSQVRVAIIGMGAMGKGLLYQCHITSGIECVAIADIKPERAIDCAKWLKCNYRVAHNSKEVAATIDKGMIAVCEEGYLLACASGIDVVIEASNSVISAGMYSETALENHKHLIMMNAEADLIFGPYLLHLSKQNDVVYTSCDGDQHGVIKHLVDDLKLWGLELIMAGNIKGFLDRYSNPTKIIPEADKRHLDYKMATAYTDGTKLSIEMALVANGLGLYTFLPGMQGPRANHVNDIFNLYDFASLWKEEKPVVDYILGAEPGGGVFAIGYCDNDYQKSMLAYYKMGQGPFYLFYRPYHLCHIEAMSCIINAALNKRTLLQPVYGFRTNVYTYAKRDLRIGEKLDGIGGYNCYGLIENCTDENNSALPVCLAEDLVLKYDRAKDEKIYLSDVSYDSKRFDFVAYSKAEEQSRRGAK